MARISLYHITFNIYSNLFYVFLLSKKSRKTGSSLFGFSLNFYKDKHRSADQTTHQSANIITTGRGKDIFIFAPSCFFYSSANCLILCSSESLHISNISSFSATTKLSSPCITTFFSCVVWIIQL